MKGKKAGLFDNKALASLILPLLVEQFLAVLVGMGDLIIWPVAFTLPIWEWESLAYGSL